MCESKCICFKSVIWLIIMKMRLKFKNRSQRHNINRPRLRLYYTESSYTESKIWFEVICTKQHLSNIWSSIQTKVKQNWNWVEQKRCI